jgi:NagD protein
MTGTPKPNRWFPGYVFDLDGTIYLGEALLPGAAEVLSTLRASGAAIAFVSNNPTRGREDVARKLKSLGIEAETDQVINSGHVLVRYLQARAPGATVFPIAESVLQAQLNSAGFPCSEDPDQIDYVIASFDRTLDYHKLQVAFDALRAGARFVATNADAFCPVPSGGQPDAGAIIAALEASSGRKVETVVGKPSPIMARAALEILGLEPDQCLLTGDRLKTDIAMAQSAGMASALILTGAATLDDLADSEVRPDFVLECLAQLLP